jgi:hypothetical protein
MDIRNFFGGNKTSVASVPKASTSNKESSIENVPVAKSKSKRLVIEDDDEDELEIDKNKSITDAENVTNISNKDATVTENKPEVQGKLRT